MWGRPTTLEIWMLCSDLPAIQCPKQSGIYMNKGQERFTRRVTCLTFLSLEWS